MINALKCAMDESASFVDPETGEVELLTFEELRLEEEDDDRPLEEFPRWKHESVTRIRALDFERLLALPSKFQIHCARPSLGEGDAM